VRTERAGVPSSRTALSDADARLGAMTWAHMVNDGAANYFPGILPAILADAHEPLSLAGSLVAAMAIGQALQPLVGWISDRVGGRAILLAGFAMTSAGGGLLGETHSMAVLVLLLLACGIGTSLFHPQALASGRGLPLAALVAYAGLRSFAIFGLVTFIPVLWRIRGDSLVTGASVITTILEVGIVGNLGGGHLTDKLGKRLVLVGSAAAVAVLVVPMGYLRGPGVWVLAGVLGCVLFMTLSTTIMIGQDIFPESPSLGSGIALGLSNATGALIVLATGLFVNRSDIHAAFFAMAGASLLAMLAALAFPARLMTGEHRPAH
jgi:MFS family permease